MPDEHGWISVEDALPEKGQAVTICCWYCPEYLCGGDLEEHITEMQRQWREGSRYQHVAIFEGAFGKCGDWNVNFSAGNAKNSFYVSIRFRDFEDGEFPITHWKPLGEPPKLNVKGEL